ncbi:multidrug DMT transporter permease [Terasakiispira papahanaumokuakeensis]|uniref:Multidrug DMT transporter permease n=1 Tax=Terasakiispira papahanaumokuakeensis TaxID=197479 RepID=A0A1E2V982_9GAMM|nr:EamA family transporter [Terasakiispira papahanaumokuakeensis]ODC03568.1 multidrug DMT transporter permease [Terasakiispira papahanaumokuakeensis]
MNAVLYGAVVLIWGTTWIAIALQQGSTAPEVSVAYRFALAAVVMLVALMIMKRLRPISPAQHLWCVAQGACVFGLNFVCFYHAAAFITSGLESVIFSMAVLFNALNARLFFGQLVRANVVWAALLGLAGITSLFWPELQAAEPNPDLFIGVGLSVLGTYGFSLGNMISQRHQRHGLDVPSTNAYAMTYGAVLMAAMAWGQGADFALDMRESYLLALIYLAVIGSVVGFTAYFVLVGRIGAGGAAYCTLLFPLVALTISTVFENYHWHASGVVGLVLILCGNLVMFPTLLQRLADGLKHRLKGRVDVLTER